MTIYNQLPESLMIRADHFCEGFDWMTSWCAYNAAISHDAAKQISAHALVALIEGAAKDAVDHLSRPVTSTLIYNVTRDHCVSLLRAVGVEYSNNDPVHRGLWKRLEDRKSTRLNSSHT